jgi:hypothetical protein
MNRICHRWPALIAGSLIVCTSLPAAEGLSLNSPAPRAHVVTAQDPNATAAFKPVPGIVTAMVKQAITNLTGKPDEAAAWTSIVSTNEVVGIKVYTAPGSDTGTRPSVTAAVIQGLLAAGMPTNHIIVWDRHETDLRRAGYFELGEQFGVRVEGAAEAGYDPKAFYEAALLGNLVFGDLEFGKKDDGVGRKSFVSKLVSQQMTKIINIAPVLNHNGAGVAGNLYSLAMSSVDNLTRFEGSPGRLATAVPEIYALPALGDRVVLNISDALICQYEGEERGLLHYSVALNEIRFSRDPVALDVLALQDLDLRRTANLAASVLASRELYKNAALLELGVADPKQIDVTVLKPAQGPTSTR